MQPRAGRTRAGRGEQVPAAAQVEALHTWRGEGGAEAAEPSAGLGAEAAGAVGCHWPQAGGSEVTWAEASREAEWRGG